MAAETQTIHSKTQVQLRHSIGYALQDMRIGAPSTNLETTTLGCPYLLEPDDYYSEPAWEIHFYADDRIGDTREITDFVNTNGVLTWSPAVTTAPAAADLFELHRRFTVAQYNDAINRAIDMASDVYLKHNVDETLILMAYKKGEQRAMKREYDIPAGFDYIRDVYIEASGTHSLIDCETVWTDVDSGGAVAAALDDDDYQEGSNSMKLTVADTISDGDIIASYDLSAAEDLSMYQKISFWIWASGALAAADLKLLMAADSAVATPIETISLPAVAANTRTFVRCTLAAPASDTAILSIGFEYDANTKANVIHIDDIRAVLDGQPRFAEPLDRRSWSIVKATTPLLKLHSDVGITPGKALRLVGQTHQAILTADTSTCIIPPRFIIQQALADLQQSVQEFDAMKIAQTEADKELKKMRVKVVPGSKAAKEF